jgi:RHS repeat-associated protein
VYFNNLTIVRTVGNQRAAHSYYPYGITWSNIDSGELHNKAFQGKDFQQNEWGEHGIEVYDFHARMYDPVLGRWSVVDPLAVASPNWSPYRAFYDNPIIYTDPTGLLEWYPDDFGNLISEEGDDINSLNTYITLAYGLSIDWDQNNWNGTKSITGNLHINELYNRYKDAKGQDRKMKANEVTLKTDFIKNYKSNAILIRNTSEATNHYFHGNGIPAKIAGEPLFNLIEGTKFLYHHNRILSGVTTEMQGFFAIDLTGSDFFVGDTQVNYSISCSSNDCIVTYSLFANDGYWDPNIYNEKVKGIKPDGMGPLLETEGGVPYPFIPIIITYHFSNPGY